jgi:hypothetical protein
VALTSTKLKNLDDLFIFIVMSDVFFDKFLWNYWFILYDTVFILFLKL